MNITSTNVFVFINVDIEIGALKLVAEVQAIIYKDKEGEGGVDIDVMDYDKIMYNGISVTIWSEFRDHHLKMGMNLNGEIQKSIDAQFSDDVKKDLIKTFMIK